MNDLNEFLYLSGSTRPAINSVNDMNESYVRRVDSQPGCVARHSRSLERSLGRLKHV